MLKKLSEKLEEDVLEKYKVEVSKGGTYKGRGSAVGVEDCPESQKSAWDYDLQRRQGIAGEPDGKGRDEAAAKDEGHDRYGKENQVEGQNGRNTQLVGQCIAGR